MYFRLLNSTQVINLLLLVASIVGLVLLVGQRTNLTQQQSVYQGLTARYGELDIGDGKGFVIVYLPTDSPYVFTWRFFCPANLTLQSQSGSAGNPAANGGTMKIADEKEFRQTVSFKFVEGYCQTFDQMHARGAGISGVNGFGSKQMNRFMESHWVQLNFEVLGSTGPVRLGTDELVPLFKVEIPESLQDEFEREVDETYRKDFLKNPIFQMRLGTPAAFTADNGGTNP